MTFTHTKEPNVSIPGELNPSPRVLLGPGPSDVHPRVLRAMSTPLVGHLDPQFLDIMNDTQDMLRLLFQTTNHLTFPNRQTLLQLALTVIGCSFPRPAYGSLVIFRVPEGGIFIAQSHNCLPPNKMRLEVLLFLHIRHLDSFC